MVTRYDALIAFLVTIAKNIIGGEPDIILSLSLFR